MLFHTAICNARMLKISLKRISLWATVYGRNPSTMETTSKTRISVEAEFYTVLIKVGFSKVLSTVLTLLPNLVKVFSQALLGAKLGKGGEYLKKNPSMSVISRKTELCMFCRVIRPVLQTTVIFIHYWPNPALLCQS